MVMGVLKAECLPLLRSSIKLNVCMYDGCARDVLGQAKFNAISPGPPAQLPPGLEPRSGASTLQRGTSAWIGRKDGRLTGWCG